MADQRAVVGDQREVGLRVAAVDGKHDHAQHLGGHLLEQRLGDCVLADQRVGEQRLLDVVVVAAQCGRDREPLVRGHVLHEAEQLGRERRLRQAARRPCA